MLLSEYADGEKVRPGDSVVAVFAVVDDNGKVAVDVSQPIIMEDVTPPEFPETVQVSQALDSYEFRVSGGTVSDDSYLDVTVRLVLSSGDSHLGIPEVLATPLPGFSETVVPTGNGAVPLTGTLALSVFGDGTPISENDTVVANIVATDSSSNSSISHVNIGLVNDRDPPVFSSEPVAEMFETSASCSWSVSDAGDTFRGLETVVHVAAYLTSDREDSPDISVSEVVEGTGTGFVSKSATSGSETTLVGLTPFRRYTLAFAALDGSGNASLRTIDSETPDETPPFGLESVVARVTSEQVDVIVENLSNVDDLDRVDSLTVLIALGPSTGEVVDTRDATGEDTVLFSGLDILTEYTVVVSATDVAGNTASRDFALLTGENIPPTGIDAVSIARPARDPDTTVDVLNLHMVEDVHSAIKKIELTAFPTSSDSDGAEVVSFVYDGNVLPIEEERTVFSGLTRLTEYDFHVLAEDVFGNVSESTVDRYMTLPGLSPHTRLDPDNTRLVVTGGVPSGDQLVSSDANFVFSDVDPYVGEMTLFFCFNVDANYDGSGEIRVNVDVAETEVLSFRAYYSVEYKFLQGYVTESGFETTAGLGSSLNSSSTDPLIVTREPRVYCLRETGGSLSLTVFRKDVAEDRVEVSEHDNQEFHFEGETTPIEWSGPIDIRGAISGDYRPRVRSIRLYGEGMSLERCFEIAGEILI